MDAENERSQVRRKERREAGVDVIDHRKKRSIVLIIGPELRLGSSEDRVEWFSEFTVTVLDSGTHGRIVG